MIEDDDEAEKQAETGDNFNIEQPELKIRSSIVTQRLETLKPKMLR